MFIYQQSQTNLQYSLHNFTNLSTKVFFLNLKTRKIHDQKKKKGEKRVKIILLPKKPKRKTEIYEETLQTLKKHDW